MNGTPRRSMPTLLGTVVADSDTLPIFPRGLTCYVRSASAVTGSVRGLRTYGEYPLAATSSLGRGE